MPTCRLDEWKCSTRQSRRLCNAPAESASLQVYVEVKIQYFKSAQAVVLSLK